MTNPKNLGFQALMTLMLFSLFTSSANAASTSTNPSTGSPRIDAQDDNLDAARQRISGVLGFKENSHDFGIVHRGEKLKYGFKFTNTGKGPLSIQGVHATCGCTAVEVDRSKDYAPGAAGTVEVSLDTTDFLGYISKTVTVMSNERHLPDRTLTIRATIVGEFEVSPPLVDFGDVNSRQGAEQIIRIKPNNGYNLAIERVRFNQDTLDVGYAKEPATKDAKNTGTWIITVKLKSSAPTGFFKDTLYVVNNSKSLPDLPIPIRANIKGSIDFTPKYLEFGAITSSDKASRSVTLQGSDEFQIVSTRTELNVNGVKIEGASDLVKISSLSHEKGKRLVTVDLTNKAGRAGSVHGKIYIETTDPQQKIVAVDVYAFFR